jgi:hypothetical protein
LTEASAMEAIFCAYDREKRGTLLPIEYTAPWNPQRAETLASPMLVAFYRQGGVRKGLLVVERQRMYEGEPSSGHAETAVVSVYIFRQNGAAWTIDQAAEEALDAGTNGHAPGPELIQVGPDRFGLWFVGGAMGQGYVNDYAYLVTMRETAIAEAGHFELGGNNSGACSDDPKERGDFIHPCWEWSATPDFIRTDGQNDYLLRLTFTGTHAPDITDQDKVAPRRGAVCYQSTSGGYKNVQDAKCGSYRGLDTREIFGVAEPVTTKPGLK